MESETESKQRFAAEMIAGITRAGKHWPYRDVEAMWDVVIPIIKVRKQSLYFNFIFPFNDQAALHFPNPLPDHLS